MEATRESMTHLEAIIAKQKCTLYRCINELCQKCKRYQYEHEGACDGCSWKQLKDEQYDVE